MKDVLQVPPEEILKTEAVMTIVAGRVVFERGKPAPVNTAAARTSGR